MKKRLKFIFFIATITACGIILCQLYWVYFNYETRKANFIQTTTFSLRQSIDQYQLSQNKIPASLTYKKPTLTFFMRRLPDDDPGVPDSTDSQRRFSAEFATVAVDSDYLPEVRTLVAKLLSQQEHKRLNLDTLNAFFHQQLQRNNIPQHFRLKMERGIKNVPTGQIAAFVNFYKDPMVVKAEMIDEDHYLLTSNFLPALVSSLLILLSAGSLYYMGRIIKRQMLLDKMKTDFINNITHELRTPITILKSSNEALANFGAAEDPESLKRYLKINASVIDNLDVDIERILEFNSSEEGKQSPVYKKMLLHEVIMHVLRRFQMNENLNMQLQVDELHEVMTDPYMLSTIMANLLDNAIKYSPDGAMIEISSKLLSRGWQLQIRDHGQGIPSAELPYIFDRFYRVSTGDIHEVKGYGIGLAYVRQLVRCLNGQIRVNSEVGKGTTFKLTFNH